MAISDIINGTSAANASTQPGKAGKKDQLGQNQFLELMVAQLKNQDPFKATDPSQFLGQLAQFGTVTGIQDMQSALGSLSEALRSSQVLGGSNLVGRDVLIAADKTTLGEGNSVGGAVEVPTGATSVELNVRDASGQLVRHIQLPTSEGLNDFNWDGASDDGTRAAAGQYTLEAIANVGGQSTSLQTLLTDRVSSVTIDANQGLTLNTRALGTHPLSDVRRVM
jgi:flagellar basal-body rod modification protein FlgD